MSNMAAFLAGFGKGYLGANEKAIERQRQAKLDERADIDWQNKQDQIQEEKAYKQALRDAGANREVQQGQVLTMSGQKLFSQDPNLTSQVKSIADNIAEMENSGPVTQTAGHAVTGAMAKGHQIGTGAAPDASKLNDPLAKLGRLADANLSHGKGTEASTLYNHIFDARLKQMNLDEAEGKFLKGQFGKILKDAIVPGDPKASLEALVTKMEFGGLSGLTGRAELGPDGRYRVFAVAPDGKQYPLPGSYENSMYGVDTAIAVANKHATADDVLKQVHSEAVRVSEARKAEAELANINAKTTALLATANQRNAKAGINPNTGELDPAWGSTGGGGGGGGGARGGQGGGGGEGSSQGGRGAAKLDIKTRRDMLSDYAKLFLKDGETTAGKDGAAPTQPIEVALQQADDIMALNADFGTVLTAPQIRRAQQLASDAANVKVVQDSTTGQYFRVVNVGGRDVLLSQQGAGIKTVAQSQQTAGARPQTQATPGQAATQAAARAADQPKTRTIAQVLNPGGNSAVDLILVPQVKRLEGYAVMYQQAKQKTASAARGGVASDVQAAAKEQQQIVDRINADLSRMQPQQAELVRKAMGIY